MKLIGMNCPLCYRGNVLLSSCGAQMGLLATILMRHLLLALCFWPILLYLKYFQTVLGLASHLIQSVNLCFLIGVFIPFLNLPYCYFFCLSICSLLLISTFPHFAYINWLFFSRFSPLLTHQLYDLVLCLEVSLELVLYVCNILQYYTTFAECNSYKLFHAWLFTSLFTYDIH